MLSLEKIYEKLFFTIMLDMSYLKMLNNEKCQPHIYSIYHSINTNLISQKLRCTQVSPMAIEVYVANGTLTKICVQNIRKKYGNFVSS